MRWTWTLALLLPIVACGGGSGGDEEIPATLPLHLAVPASDLNARVLPALLEPLDDAVEEFVADTVREVVVDRLSAPNYGGALTARFQDVSHPDLVWVPATLLGPLIDAGWLIPLEDQIAAAPGVMLGTEPWMQELYVREGHTFGVPVGEKGHHPLMAYAITAAADERGHLPAAFDLLRHLRRRLPARGLPDVALDELVITVEDGSGGDIIVENHYLDGLVRNLGDAPAENVHLLVEADGLGVIEEVTIPWIESLGNVPLRVDLGDPAPGQYVLQATLDFDNTVVELNETNNKDHVDWSYQLNAGGSGPTSLKALSGPITIEAVAYTTSANGMAPKVASDGSNYIVVYAKQPTLSLTQFNHQLRAKRVSAAGVVLDATPISITSKVSKHDAFDVAFGGSQYLVVWEDDNNTFPESDPASRILAARVTTAGVVLDTTPILVDAATDSSYRSVYHEVPNVFWDGSHFVVVYRDKPHSPYYPAAGAGYQYGIFAKRISSSGQVQPGKVKLQASNDSFFALNTQHVTFAAGEGLVIFEGIAPTTRGIYGRYFGSTGGDPTPSSLAVFMSTTQMNALMMWPCVAQSTQSKYLGVWSRHFSTGNGKYFQTDLATVGGPGSVTVGRGPIATKAGDRCNAVAYDGKAYTIATSHSVGCHAYVGAFRMNQAGVWAPASVLSGHNLVGMVDIAYGGANGLIAYENQKPPTTYYGSDWYWGIYAKLVDQSQ